MTSYVTGEAIEYGAGVVPKSRHIPGGIPDRFSPATAGIMNSDGISQMAGPPSASHASATRRDSAQARHAADPEAKPLPGDELDSFLASEGEAQGGRGRELPRAIPLLEGP